MSQREIRFKVPEKTYQNLIAFGEEHDICSERTGRIMPNSVAQKIIRYVLRMHVSPNVMEIKEKEGGTTLDIITRAVHRHFLI